MKKIYILTAIFALLTLSLNAQKLKVDQSGNVPQPKAQTEKEVTRPDGYFRSGPTRDSSTPVTPPYTNGFGNGETSWWQVIDANSDNKTWTFSSNRAVYSYHDTNAANDWLITAPVYLEAGKVYKFYIDASIRSTSYPEKLEVKLSTTNTASALSSGTTVIGSTTLTSQTSTTLSKENITVSQTGNYYFGIHAISDANMWELYVDNLVIDVEDTDPEIQVSTNTINLHCQPNQTATETVEVTGLNLATGITATVSGQDASLFSVSPTSLNIAGGTLTITYSPTAVGSHTATITLSNADADNVTITVNGTCKSEVTVCDGTNTSSTLPLYGSWVDNFQINQMIYPEITELIGTNIKSMTFYANSNISSKLGDDTWVIKLGTTDQTTFGTSSNLNSAVTRLVPDDIQQVYSGYLTTGSNTLTITFDTPFEYNGGNLLIDFEETYTSGDYSGTTFYGVTQGTNYTGFHTYSSNQSSLTNGRYTSGGADNFLPKVTFEFEPNTEPKIKVSPETLTISDSGTNNTFTVQGSNLGTDNVGVTVPDGSGFTRTTNDQYWGFVNNNGSVSGTATIGYEGRDLSASTTVSVGNNLVSTTVAVTYRADLYIVGDFGNGWDFSTGTPMTYNSDNNTYTATVTVDDGNLILFARKLGESNPWNTRYVFGPNSSGDWWVDTNPKTGTIDLNDDDPIYFVNAGTYTVTIDATTGALTIETLVLPPPENVVAVADSENQSATVTWDAPSTLPIQSVTEGFEDTSIFPSFSAGGITDTQHTGAFGNWTLYDATGGCIVYGSKEINFEHEGEPHAWFVFKPSEATADQDYPNAVAHDSYSGAQYLESICPTSGSTAAGQSDHWLISPELSGNAQTISFYISELTTIWGNETYEIWVSTTDNTAPASFSKLGETYTVDHDTWEKQTVQLPANTKYFAIRHTSNDIFGLLIDDVTYESVISPVSYNVYLDGVLVGSVDANDPLTYDISNVSGGTHTASVSAVYPGNVESALVSDTFTLQAKTPTPTIEYEVTNGTVVITATGEGHVTLVVDGITYEGEGSATATVVRSPEDRIVTATATAQQEGALESNPASQPITIPALNTTPTNPASGLLRLHLLIVDQMKEEIPADNSHPDKYGYVLRYEPNGPQGAGVKESGSVKVEIQKADCEVMGAYTLAEVDNDKNIGAYDAQNDVMTHDLGIKMNVISADVEYDLSDDNDILYAYLLQGAENRVPGYQADFLTELQKTQNFTYVEMEESNPNKGTEYPNGEHHFFVGEENLKTGAYGSSYMSYAPSVSTWGISRRYYEDDGYDNTYGAPIWKTGAGDVIMNGKPTAELQTGASGSTNWEYEGQACSLYILDNIEAVGKLPHSEVATVEYEPYMFRVFVESKNGLLRNFQKVDGDGVTTGEHYEGIAGDPYGPICVWSGYVADAETQGLGQTFTPGATSSSSDAQPTLTFKKVKVDRTNADGEWDQDETNAIFGAVDALAIAGYDDNHNPIYNQITSDDLNIFVRYYYVVKGSADDHEVHSGRRDGDSSRPGNGSESPGKSPDPQTAVKEINYNGEVVSVTYVNALGMQSNQPFDGVNIVITRYSDGKVRTTKVTR